MKQINAWIKKHCCIPEDATISVKEIQTGKFPPATEIHIAWKGNNKRYYVEKAVEDITGQDIIDLHIHFHSKEKGLKRFYPGILRFFGMWAAVSGAYAIYGVCPCCGQTGCPVGAGSAGILGGIFAFGMQNWKAFIQKIRSVLRTKKV